jgi:hypothetical protein
MDRLDKARIVGGISERQAELFDGGVKAIIKLHIVVRGPQLLSKLFSSDYLPGTLQQECQHLERLVLETYAKAIPGEDALLQVGLKKTESCQRFPSCSAFHV